MQITIKEFLAKMYELGHGYIPDTEHLEEMLRQNRISPAKIEYITMTDKTKAIKEIYYHADSPLRLTNMIRFKQEREKKNKKTVSDKKYITFSDLAVICKMTPKQLSDLMIARKLRQKQENKILPTRFAIKRQFAVIAPNGKVLWHQDKVTNKLLNPFIKKTELIKGINQQ